MQAPLVSSSLEAAPARDTHRDNGEKEGKKEKEKGGWRGNEAKKCKIQLMNGAALLILNVSRRRMRKSGHKVF